MLEARQDDRRVYRREPERRQAAHAAAADQEPEPDGRARRSSPGGIIEKAAAAAGLERDGRLPGLQPADPRRHGARRKRRATHPRARLQARRLRPGDRPLMATAKHRRVTRPRGPRLHAAPEAAVRRASSAAAEGRARPLADAGAAHLEDHAQHGRRRGQDRREAARRRDRGADDHRRAARAGAPRTQVDRAVQDPRGHADRREGHAARRPHVGVPRPARVDRAAAHPRLPRAQPALVRRPRATTRSAFASRSSFPRSTTTTSRRSAGSTSRSRPPPKTDDQALALLRALGLPFAGRAEGAASKWQRSRWSIKQARPQKFKTRAYTRCNRCGRPRAVFRKFGLCRICLRELAHQGAIPGMTKSSW